MEITEPGSYVLTEDCRGSMTIRGQGIALCGNGHQINGALYLYGTDLLIENVTVAPPSAQDMARQEGGIGEVEVCAFFITRENPLQRETLSCVVLYGLRIHLKNVHCRAPVPLTAFLAGDENQLATIVDCQFCDVDFPPSSSVA